MGRGEYEVFRAAMRVTKQPLPKTFYVFPQVNLGQFIRTGAVPWRQKQANNAHRAINTKRCDFIIADRNGNPVTAIEFQGAGHNIGNTAERRDEIKRIALERAGIPLLEIPANASSKTMEEMIEQGLLAQFNMDKNRRSEERRPPFP